MADNGNGSTDFRSVLLGLAIIVFLVYVFVQVLSLFVNNVAGGVLAILAKVSSLDAAIVLSLIHI